MVTHDFRKLTPAYSETKQKVDSGIEQSIVLFSSGARYSAFEGPVIMKTFSTRRPASEAVEVGHHSDGFNNLKSLCSLYWTILLFPQTSCWILYTAGQMSYQ